MGILGIAWDGMGVNGTLVFKTACQDFWPVVWLWRKYGSHFSESQQYFVNAQGCG
ncbi:hypothetical protein FHS63_000700 [Azospirillum doebereinerae]